MEHPYVLWVRSLADSTRWLDVFGLDLTDQMTFKEAFRRAKQQLRITKHINTPKPVHVYDKQDENRAVWAFKGDYQRKSPLNPGKHN